MKKLPWLMLLISIGSVASAADLMEIYRDAKSNDPVFAAARATRDAGMEKANQGLAGLLPTINATGNTVWNENDVTNRTTGVLSPFRFNSNAYVITLTQPLFRWQTWVQYDQSKLQSAQAEVQFLQAKQDLILRTTQAYFDVLLAEESLKTVQAQKESIAQQLAQAKKYFEVGTATITDTHEAQSRFDLASAQEIAADNELAIKEQVLESLLGKIPGELAPLKSQLALNSPQPADVREWAEAAGKASPSVQIQQAASEIASKELSKSRGNHLPTLDIVANQGHSVSVFAGNMTETNYRNIGLQVALPLFQGGAMLSKDREAAANYLAAKANLDAARRSATVAARQSYLGVTNGLAQVKALEAALVSSQSALDANKLGYEVGVRINIDVLNAQQQLSATRRDLAKARFDTLMAQLKLKAAVGTLSEADVEQINGLLESKLKQ